MCTPSVMMRPVEENCQEFFLKTKLESLPIAFGLRTTYRLVVLLDVVVGEECLAATRTGHGGNGESVLERERAKRDRREESLELLQAHRKRRSEEERHRPGACHRTVSARGPSVLMVCEGCKMVACSTRLCEQP
jgi:hypothetical protein